MRRAPRPGPASATAAVQRSTLRQLGLLLTCLLACWTLMAAATGGVLHMRLGGEQPAPGGGPEAGSGASEAAASIGSSCPGCEVQYGLLGEKLRWRRADKRYAAAEDAGTPALTCGQLRSVTAILGQLQAAAARAIAPPGYVGALDPVPLQRLQLPELALEGAAAVVEAAQQLLALVPACHASAGEGAGGGASAEAGAQGGATAADVQQGLQRLVTATHSLLLAQHAAGQAAVRRVAVAALWLVRRGTRRVWNADLDALHRGALLRWGRQQGFVCEGGGGCAGGGVGRKGEPGAAGG
jgi:hypothetical protein